MGLHHIIGGGIWRPRAGGPVPPVDEDSLVHLETAEVTGSAVAVVSFTGLTLADRAGLLLVSRIVSANLLNPISAKGYINGDTTTSNYATQDLDINSGTLSSSRATSLTNIMRLTAAESGVGTALFQMTPGGYASVLAEFIRDSSAGALRMGYSRYAKTDAPVVDITAIQVSTGSNSIGVGSTFDLYAIERL
jgi:hypothetical protein